jgi:ABC-type uncharacterized transport system substrate-binding protein
MLGLDTDGDGLYSREETAELAEVNVTSLADFHFFTSMAGAATTDRLGDLYSETFQAPVDYYLEHDGVRTTLHFTLPLSSPVVAADHDLVILDIYDPEFFVAFSLVEEDPITLVDAPAACALTIDEPPDLDDSYASILSLIPADEAVPEELSFGDRATGEPGADHLPMRRSVCLLALGVLLAVACRRAGPCQPVRRGGAERAGPRFRHGPAGRLDGAGAGPLL